MKTFLFHDYETYDLDTRKARVSQYASIRTDENLNIIPGEEQVLYCLPHIDYLPSPEACLVTGITPFDILERAKNPDTSSEVFSEYDFFTKINQEFSSPSTCSLGYNSMRYDDEISRNGFYRNLLPVYDREWKSDCSRWDMISVVRMYAFLYPNEINIPSDEDGKPSFRLEKLSVANGFKIENEGEAGANFHDALTDVRATIFMAKMMKEAHPEFWNFFLEHKNKNKVKDDVSISKSKMALVCSTYFGSDSKFVEPCFLMAFHKKDVNCFISIKLTDLEGIRNIISMSPEEIKSKLYVKKDDPDYTSLPIHQIKVNQAPSILPFDKMSEIFGLEDPSSKLVELGKDVDLMRSAYALVRDNFADLQAKIGAVFNNEFKPEPAIDPELAIYGGFAPRGDEQKLFEFHKNIGLKKFTQYFQKNHFEDKRYNELARRLILRNFMDDVEKVPELSAVVDEWYKTATFKIHKGYDNRLPQGEEPEMVLARTLSTLKETLPTLEKDADERGLETLTKFKKSINLQFNKLKEKGGLNQTEDNSAKNGPKP